MRVLEELFQRVLQRCFGGGLKCLDDSLFAELIFLATTAFVLFIRLDHPQISFTENPMHLVILASLLRADGFPPPDMWLAGESLPYYYWGALLWSVPLSTSASIAL